MKWPLFTPDSGTNKLLDRIEGQNGRFVSIERGPSGRVAHIVDDQGRKAFYTYDPRGRLETVADLGGNVWRYKYDRSGRLERVIDPRDIDSLTVSYDSASRIQRARVVGIQYRYTYKGTVTLVQDDADQVTHISRDPSGVTTSLTNPEGFVSEVMLDERQRITTLLHNRVPRAAISYDAAGKIGTLRRFDSAGSVDLVPGREREVRQTPLPGNENDSSAVLDSNVAADQLRGIVGDKAAQYKYTPEGDLQSVTTAGKTTVYTHNADGQIETIESPLGTTRLAYFRDGKVRSIQFTDGSLHQYRYSALGFRQSVERSDGTSAGYEYDAAGNLLSASGMKADGGPAGLTLEIDKHNRASAVRYESGERVAITYDTGGNPRTITHAGEESAALEYIYDGSNRVVAVQDGELIAGRYQYAETEPDLRVQMDDRTMRVEAGTARQSASVGNILSLVYTRPYGSFFGTVRYDEATRSLDIPSDLASSPPAILSTNSLIRRKLLDVDTGSVRARANFDRPSNVVFLPPEYATINCVPPCVFTGVILTGNGSLGSVSVPVGSTVTLLATKKSGTTCQTVIYDWTLNGVPMPWSFGGPQLHTFNTTGTHLVGVQAECSGCDLLRSASLQVIVTSAPPPPVGPPVTITYTTFIPLDHVRLTPPYSEYFYEADNQGSYAPGLSTFRVQKSVTVRTGQGIVSSPEPQSALSRLFIQNSPTTNLTTSGTCFRKNCPQCTTYPGFGTPITFEGHCLIHSQPDQGSARASGLETVRAELTGAGYYDANRNYVTVRLRGEPKIGISPNLLVGALSPAIDWDVTVNLTRNTSTGATTYTVVGNHDGFPFHDIRINSTQVWGRDPIPNGDTPLSLGPPAEILLNRQGSL